MAIASITSFKATPSKNFKSMNQERSSSSPNFRSSSGGKIAPRKSLGLIAAALATVSAMVVTVGCDASVTGSDKSLATGLTTDASANADSVKDTKAVSDTVDATKQDTVKVVVPPKDTAIKISPLMQKLSDMYDLLLKPQSTAISSAPVIPYKPVKGDITKINTHVGEPFNIDGLDTLSYISTKGDTIVYDAISVDPVYDDTTHSTKTMTQSPDGKGVIVTNTAAKFPQKYLENIDVNGKPNVAVYTLMPDSALLVRRKYSNPADPTKVKVTDPDGTFAYWETTAIKRQQ